MKTIHLVGNAHLDPVWLWQQWEGVDAVLATARSACDRLDEYPQFIFTCSGSWFHGQVQRIDPPLFERIRRFVLQGRWQLVGGMVVQPDCNLPSADSFRRQLDAGQRYYQDNFGRPTSVGYNVDSFGHTAYLPAFLRQAGIDCYCFLRPGPNEKQLPASVFNWQSPDGQQVAAFRISGAYCHSPTDLRSHIQRSIDEMPAGLDHTMCFYGVGDHGGGPTRQQIQWALDNADCIPGFRLVLSHPRAFFDAIADRLADLPVVRGELQHHAVGCYSVERRIKVAMVSAEARLAQADKTRAAFPHAADPEDSAALGRARDWLMFNQFHDILGGTSLDVASLTAASQLRAAEASAQDVITSLTRRGLRHLADPGKHQIVVFNASDDDFSGPVEFGPWVADSLLHDWRLVDETGRVVPCQRIAPQAKMHSLLRLLFGLDVPAGGHRVLELQSSRKSEYPEAAGRPKIDPQCAAGALASGSSPVRFDGGRLSSAHVSLAALPGGVTMGGWQLTLPVFGDPTDTWTHCDSATFSREQAGQFQWSGPWEVVESGPLRTAIRNRAVFGNSSLWCRLLLGVDGPLEMRLSVNWAQERQRLVLRLASMGMISQRIDLVSGGPLDRPMDAREYPLAGGLLVSNDKSNIAAASADVFSVSVSPDSVDLTLIRSPFVAHHDPTPADIWPDYPVTDQGRHEFVLRILPNCKWDVGCLQRQVRQMLAPPIVWDVTG